MPRRRAASRAAGGDAGGHSAASTAAAPAPGRESDRGNGALRSMNAAAIGVFSALLCVYWSTLHPSLPGGDSGELVAVAHVGGVAHPPGYPLFTMALQALAAVSSDWGTPAFRANAFSAVCGAGAGAALFVTTSRVTGSLASGVLSAALFGLARLQWMYSVTGEVFALNNLLVGLVLLQLVRHDASPSLRSACTGAFLCGLALSNQHTAVLFVAVVAPWVLWRGRHAGTATPSAIVALAMCGLLGLAPYAYLPLSARRGTAALTWGNQTTVDGFLTHVLRREYGTFDLAKGGRETASFWRAAEAHGRALAEETWGVCPLFAVACVGALAWRALPARQQPLPRDPRPPSKQDGAVAVMTACLVFYAVFFNWRANLDLGNPLLAGVHERFWMQPNYVACLLAGVGFDAALSAACACAGVPRRRADAVGVAAAVAFAAVVASASFRHRDESGNFAVRDFGAALLEGLPRGSILLTKGDLPANAARYVQRCEGVRPDVRVIDLEMMTFPWYVPAHAHTWPGVVFPGRDRVYSAAPGGFTMAAFLDANIGRRDVFVYEGLNPEDASWESGFELWRHGVARAVKRRGEPLNASAWLASALAALPDFSLPDAARYDERKWERVVRDVASEAGVHLALFFEERARAAQGDRAKIELYRAASAVYERIFSSAAFDGHREPFWHKNAGLTWWELSRLTGHANHARTMRTHWRAYLDAKPDDPQVRDIELILQSG